MTAPALTLRSVRTHAVDVPMKHALGTSAMTVRSAPLLLVDVGTGEGVTGRTYLFCYLKALAGPIAAVIDECLRVLKGQSAAPADVEATLARHFRLSGRTGIVNMAMAAIDEACWDAVAQASGVPLAVLLGGSVRPVPAYNSSGLGLMLSPDAAADEAEALLEGGFRGVKLRLGHPTIKADLAAVRAVRKRIPPGVALMVDYNQALTAAEALERGRALDGEGVYWMEEPLRHDDYAGSAALAGAIDTPVQIGENFAGVQAMELALNAKACDCVMPDAERIGGVSGWQRAAALAAAREVRMSSHLFPELSAHLLTATPTAHWLEYVDWAAPLLQEPLAIVDGSAVMTGKPGNGIAWNDEAVQRYRMK
jgi:mandelate racemase